MDNSFTEGKYSAQKKFVHDVYLAAYRMMSFEEVSKILGQETNTEFQQYFDVYKNPQKYKPAYTKNWLITIRSREDELDWSSLSEIVKTIHEYKNFLISPKVEYEQSSEDASTPSGWHVHIACRLFTNKADVIKRICNAIRKNYGTYEKSWVDIKQNPVAYEYVAGEKADHKMKKVVIDEKLRRKYQKILYYPIIEECPNDEDTPQRESPTT